MERDRILLAILLLLSVISCFLPWFTTKVTARHPWRDEEYTSTYTNYGYDYIIPLGARYTAPVAILNVIGFILSAYSFKATERIRKLNVRAGVLILVGAIAAFAYTLYAYITEPLTIALVTYELWPEYGLGLEAFFGFLMIIVGRRCLKDYSCQENFRMEEIRP